MEESQKELTESEKPAVQRRAHFRAAALSKVPIELVVWKITPHWILRDKPKPSMQLRVEFIDVSLGGMRFSALPHRLGPSDLAIHDRLRIEITFKEEQAVFDAEIVYRSKLKEDESAHIGVVFRKVENSIEGRRGINLLNQVVAAIQRENIKYTAAQAIPAA